jgi:hypothetical protein
MRLAGIAAVLLLTLTACQQDTPQPVTPSQPAMFGPRSIQLHPIFTQIRDFSGDGVPDGIDAVVEFTDQFGDPTKASGTILFELYAYRRDWPDPRGNRLCPPWLGQIESRSEQRKRWDRTSRAYTFALSAPMVSPTSNYILTATYEPEGGPAPGAPRLFAETMIAGKPKPKPPHSRMPTSLFPSTDESPDQTTQPSPDQGGLSDNGAAGDMSMPTTEPSATSALPTTEPGDMPSNQPPARTPAP